MKTLRYITAAILALCLAACHDAPKYADDPYGNFDCLWNAIDRNYCFFAEKDVDWQEVGQRYRARIVPDITPEELFCLCAEMLAELRDGHVNLSSGFNTSYYRRWWSDYPQDFDYRTVQQYYLHFDYLSIGSIDYKILPQNVGYIRYPSFSSMPGEGNLDNMFAYLSACDAIIIDIRDNGGGLLTNIEPFVRRMIHQTLTAGYISHKTGPGHNDFSEPYPIEYRPADPGRIVWNKPVAVLTNRSCFSAANSFAMVMKQVPGCVLVGARTGGGGGLPFSSELPNGWGVRFSASAMTDARGLGIENGIDPSPGLEMHAPAERLAEGHDDILDLAIAYLTGSQPIPQQKQ